MFTCLPFSWFTEIRRFCPLPIWLLFESEPHPCRFKIRWLLFSTHTSLVLSSQDGLKLKKNFHFSKTANTNHPTYPRPQIPYALAPTDAAVAQQLQNASGLRDFQKDQA